MENSRNNSELEFLLNHVDKIQAFLQKQLHCEYQHISVNGLILSPFIQSKNEYEQNVQKLKTLRTEIQRVTPYILESDGFYPYWIRQSVNYWGSTEFFTRAYALSAQAKYQSNFDEIGRLDFMYQEASEINMNWIDSLIDYKDTETLVYQLWDEIDLPISQYAKQPSFLDHLIEVMLKRTTEFYPTAKYIGWIDSKESMYTVYWPREKRFVNYVKGYLERKGSDLRVKLITIENLPSVDISEIGAIYNMISPNELAPVMNNEISKQLLELVESGKLISPIHTYPLESKALQALYWDDKLTAELGIDQQTLKVIRKIFPKTQLLSEVLKSMSLAELQKQYAGWYLKHTYSWCGQKVMKIQNDCIDMGTIIKDCIENPVSWIIQEPAEHVHVSHIQFSQWDEKISKYAMIADSGVQYHYNPALANMYTTSCSRNSLHSDKGIVTHNNDNVFRPAVVLLSKE